MFRRLPFQKDLPVERKSVKCMDEEGERAVNIRKILGQKSWQGVRTKDELVYGNGDRIFADVKCQDRYVVYRYVVRKMRNNVL